MRDLPLAADLAGNANRGQRTANQLRLGRILDGANARQVFGIHGETSPTRSASDGEQRHPRRLRSW